MNLVIVSTLVKLCVGQLEIVYIGVQGPFPRQSFTVTNVFSRPNLKATFEMVNTKHINKQESVMSVLNGQMS